MTDEHIGAIGQKLSFFRESRGYNISALASLLNIESRHLLEIEWGIREITLQQFQDVAEVLGVSLF
jgi:transcriptional regulator with XRE-family HTH domain